MTWQNQDFVIQSNPETEAALRYLFSKLTPLHTPVSSREKAIEQELEKEPFEGILNIHRLMLVLMNTPQPLVRKHLLKGIKDELQKMIKNLPDEIHSGPLFYPDAKTKPKLPEKAARIQKTDVFIIQKISRALLLYETYSDDKEYLTAGGFIIQLIISRLWSSLLRNTQVAEWQSDSDVSDMIYATARQVLQRTLGNINYLKAENSWMYEDYREQYQFSEIKETALWKDIINQLSANPAQNRRSLVSDQYNIWKEDIPGFLNTLRNMGVPGSVASSDPAFESEFLAKIWNTAMFICLGLSLENHKPTFSPFLPPGWKSFRIPVHLRNTILEFDADKHRCIVRNKTPNSLDIMLYNRAYSITGFDEITVIF
jgi:hypothetical protein